MKMRSIFTSILLFIFTILLILPFVRALEANDSRETSKFSLTCESTEIEKGKNMKIGFNISSSECQNISAFRVKVKFDSSLVSYKNITPKNDLKLADFKTSLIADTLTIIYLTSEFGFFTDMINPLEIFDINFIANSNASGSEALFSANVDGISDYELNELYFNNPDNLSVKIVDEVIPDCTLSSLIPSDGELNPSFDPHIFNYYLDVPYDINKIEVEAEAKSESSKIKINRTTLGRAGTSTDIKIVVSQPNTKYKITYTITVNRASKPPKDSSSSNSSNKSNKKRNSSNSNHNSSIDYDETEQDNIEDSDISSENDSNDEDNNETVDAISSNVDDNNSNSKVIYVKENSFNVYLAGICTICVIILIIYFMKNIRSSKIKKL